LLKSGHEEHDKEVASEERREQCYYHLQGGSTGLLLSAAAYHIAKTIENQREKRVGKNCE
jgi:hypothetical protein